MSEAAPAGARLAGFFIIRNQAGRPTVTGGSGSALNPGSTATRAEAAQMPKNFIEKI